MTHPNAMTAWDEIRCQRGHDHHDTCTVHVSLGGPTAYRNYSPIPEDMAISFDMLVWDWEKYPVDGGPYCPAHDAVSETIGRLGVWEPRETILAMHAFQNANGGIFVDMGAQLGWYTKLANLYGLDVAAFECDPDNLGVLAQNWTGVPLLGHLTIDDRRIGPLVEPPAAGARICLAKIDIEGAERDAVRMLGPAIQAGHVDRILMEVSPVFDDYYGDLVVDLVMAGYNAYLLPESQNPPVVMDGTTHNLDEIASAGVRPDALRDWVNGRHQDDIYFVRDGVE